MSQLAGGQPAAPRAPSATGSVRGPTQPEEPPVEYRVLASRTEYRGRIIEVRVDQVAMPDGSVAVREAVRHAGAVAVVALDGPGRVVLIRQYRHPVGMHLVELPAGLLDVPGEPALLAAQRELFEEVGIRAASWHTLLDLRSSPGVMDEAVRVFLARELVEVPAAERHAGVHEEHDLGAHRRDLDAAVHAVFSGEIQNSIAVAGLLAAARARSEGWTPLRAPDAPWLARPAR